MAVNSVPGTSLQRDLAGALRLARTQSIDTSAFKVAGREAGTTQSGSASQASTSASAPAMSNDLMASLLQLQSDLNKMGLQNGPTTPADPSTSADATQASQGSDAAAPTRHRRHHVRPSETDPTDGAQAGRSGAAADAVSASGTASTASTATTSTDLGDGLQSFLQQITKAIAAYATGGPAGIAAAALTAPSKA